MQSLTLNNHLIDLLPFSFGINNELLFHSSYSEKRRGKSNPMFSSKFEMKKIHTKEAGIVPKSP
jgi:hypothetical protein